MLYAIISDIHANLAAFAAVLGDIESRGGVQKFWCLGDIVGYGPDPSECIRMLKQYDHVCVAGNHDLGAIGVISTDQFNTEAAAACRWTSRRLSPADVDYLAGLPLTLDLSAGGTDREGDFTLAHGSPRDPVWEYLLSTGVAGENFSAFKTAFCLVGHSHVPLIFKDNRTGDSSVAMFEPEGRLRLGKERMIINPGAVGQPRDNDPRASYAILDSQDMVMTLHRVVYDIQSTQQRMMEMGLPSSLASRLTYGV